MPDDAMPDDEKLREVRILLVEDSPTDADLALRALERGDLSTSVIHAHDGEQALAILNQSGDYSDYPRPDLVLLDLNLPRINGLQVLREVRANEALRSLPIVVLTTSADDSDIQSVYACGGNTYVVKPVDLTKFFDAVDNIQQYWFRTAALPRLHS